MSGGDSAGQSKGSGAAPGNRPRDAARAGAAADAPPAQAAAGTARPDVERPGGLFSKVSDALVMYHDPRNLHAEQYRACRTNLAALNRSRGPWVVVVTSSKHGEGKSVTAANVACCLAEVPGARVCLVDADFRSPSQAALFGLPPTPGLEDLLAQRVPLAKVQQATVIPHLSVIAAGAEPKNTADLMGGERFASLLSELRRHFTWVLIDTPPVNPYTDACVLSARCNGVLLVVRMEHTHKDLVQRSMASIARAGGKVLGSFLTGLPTDREDADRVGYYRVEAEDREVGEHAAEREKGRRDAEKRLREQERAFMDRKQKASDREGPGGGRSARDDEPDV